MLSTPRSRRFRSYRPHLEVLEIRNLLSTFTVDHLADDMAGDELNGSLRYCIIHAADGDAITFGVIGTINLSGALPDLTHSISIEGPGADLLTVRRDTGGSYSIFTVPPHVTASFSGLTIANGYADLGGGINMPDSYATVIVTNCTLAGNSAIRGGGINSEASHLTVSNSVFSGNSASRTGGGIATDALGMLTVSDTVFFGNNAMMEGGAIENGRYATAVVSNSTFFGNFASEGGAISNLERNNTLTVTDSTLSGNSASGGRGGGISNFVLASLFLRNTILAGNMADQSPDLYGNVGSRGHNLIGSTDGGSGFDSTDLLNVDPMLGPLQDNGGPTWTMALLPGSPALNAGDPNELGSTDQRGVVRSGGVNIGAYQASASAFLLSAPDMVQAGVPFDVTVTAMDTLSQVAVGYTGTATFSTSDPDPGVVLPADYTFTLDDGGSHTFTDTGLGEITLITAGDQTLAVTDTADNTITGSAIVTVSGTAPGVGSRWLGQSPPSKLQASASQAQSPIRSEPAGQEVVAVDRWFASLHEGDYAGSTLSRMKHHARGEMDSSLANLFGGDDLLFV